MAAKEEKLIKVDGQTTLRRNATSKVGGQMLTDPGQYSAARRQHIDSGYCGSDVIDKRWMEGSNDSIPKWSPLHIRTENRVSNGQHGSPILLSPGSTSNNGELSSDTSPENEIGADGLKCYEKYKGSGSVLTYK